MLHAQTTYVVAMMRGEGKRRIFAFLFLMVSKAKKFVGLFN